MSSEESITLNPAKHEKLGVYHCDVVTEGRVAVAGAPRDIADGESLYFEHCNISVKRDGSEYTFSRGQEAELAMAS